MGVLSSPFVNLRATAMVKINDPEPGELIINIAKGRISKEEGTKRGGLITWRGEGMEIGSYSVVPRELPQ